MEAFLAHKQYNEFKKSNSYMCLLSNIQVLRNMLMVFQEILIS